MGVAVEMSDAGVTLFRDGSDERHFMPFNVAAKECAALFYECLKLCKEQNVKADNTCFIFGPFSKTRFEVCVGDSKDLAYDMNKRLCRWAHIGDLRRPMTQLNEAIRVAIDPCLAQRIKTTQTMLSNLGDVDGVSSTDKAAKEKYELDLLDLYQSTSAGVNYLGENDYADISEDVRDAINPKAFVQHLESAGLSWHGENNAGLLIN